MKESERKEQIKDFVNEIGESLKKQLNRHYNSYNVGLPYNTLMPRYTKRCKMLGLTLDQFSDLLEESKFIKVVTSIGGRRYVLAGDTKMTNDEIHEWFEANEIQKESQREFRRASRL